MKYIYECIFFKLEYTISTLVAIADHGDSS